ncbi:MAG: hypothetical protein Q4E89_00995 [Eubacteriales bacterium]|nr:hypothetical protein [Eubacteriales bacterium]
MKEKRIIYYSRTYRRIKVNKIKYILYICLLILPALLFLWFHLDDLTRWMCEVSVQVLKKYCPEVRAGIRTERYALFGNLSYLSARTVYPGFRTSVLNAVASFFAIAVIVNLPWKGRPVAIYLLLNTGIHLINSLWFVFGERYFPYSLTTYSELYMLQEIGIWIVFLVMTGLVTGMIGDRGFIYKFLAVAAVMAYSILFGVLRYMVFMYFMYRYSIIYMALCYFTFGPMFDFLYLVMIYAIFVNRMIKIYDSGKGREAWRWS